MTNELDDAMMQCCNTKLKILHKPIFGTLFTQRSANLEQGYSVDIRIVAPILVSSRLYLIVKIRTCSEMTSFLVWHIKLTFNAN